MVECVLFDRLPGSTVEPPVKFESDPVTRNANRAVSRFSRKKSYGRKLTISLERRKTYFSELAHCGFEHKITILHTFRSYTALQKFGITLASWSTRGNTATQMNIFFRNITQNIFKLRMMNARYMITTLP